MRREKDREVQELSNRTASSHPLQWPDAQQPQRGAEHIPRTQIQPHPRARALDVGLALDHDGLPRARDRVRKAERKRDDAARLVRAQRGAHDVGVRPEQERDLARSGVLRERLRRDRCGGRQREELGVLARERGQPDVRVLEVRAGVALEGRHAVPVEVVVIYSGSLQGE